MKRSRKGQIALKILKFFFVLLCLGGFLYQTSEFLFLYWTYPTVVDIQQIEPTHLDMPSFSICNSIGYNYSHICTGFDIAPCLPSNIHRFSAGSYCKMFPNYCFDGNLPRDLQILTYTGFMTEVKLKPKDHAFLSVNLEDYMSCEIEFAGETKKCDLESVMGSMYSKEDLPQYCFAIYSLWGNPNKKRAQIPKGSVLHFRFVLNSTLRPDPTDPKEAPQPRYGLPGNPSVQIAVHSPYSLPSPILDGMSFLGGRAYEVRLKMSERHLLPSPYQTNCTDYMQIWRQRGGIGPVDQMGTLQECRVNKTYATEGCVPLSLDYPHNYDLCPNCFPGPCNFSTFAEECGKLAEIYTQPCTSMAYETDKEDRVITTFNKIESKLVGVSETIRQKILAYDCEWSKMFRKECSTIDVYFLFDRFEITNLTYNPKFESLELFSVIGGYMGMWLGISLLTVYDFIGTIIVMVRAYAKKRQDKTRIQKIKKDKFEQNYDFGANYRNYPPAKHVSRRINGLRNYEKY